MPSIAESAAAKPEFPSTIVSGLETLDQTQTITFTKYIRVVLPIDGFVFWVRADLLQPSSIVNQCAPGQVTPAQIAAPCVFDVDGSLHYATVTQQQEDGTFGQNRVIFTSESDVQPLNFVGPVCIYIAVIDDIRFAFSRRESFYRQADIFHYAGDAIYPAMATQIIDDLDSLAIREIVVSNSLPLWLALMQPTGFSFLPGCGIALYPSFAVPDNLPPPYAAVHVTPEATQSMQLVPFVNVDGRLYQLSRDRVRLTLYGIRNDAALNFLQYVVTHSQVIEQFGLMSPPSIRDEKRQQTELRILAQKKTIEFDVDYYQSTVAIVAQQFITSAFVTTVPAVTTLYNNGGFVSIANNWVFPNDPAGLSDGDLWNNFGMIGIIPGAPPSPSAPLVAFASITPTSLLALGGANLPTTPPAASGYLWNNGGLVAVS